MSEIILHHYGLSPFAEKVRTALGLKGLAWRSVDVAPLPSSEIARMRLSDQSDT